MDSKQQCRRSRAKPGDGRDNDCDGRIDEEILDGIDNDGDGKVDEDMQLVIIFNYIIIVYSYTNVKL